MIRVLHGTNPELVARCLALRREVFIVEQGVPEADDVDGHDDECVHFLAQDDGADVGAARLWTHEYAKAQRVAVRKTARGRGIGVALMVAIEQEAAAQGFDEVRLGAQLQAIPFYERIGYHAEGPPFLDAGIAHRQMRKAVR